MNLFLVFIVLSVIAVIIEIIVPTMFCINFALSGIITSVISLFWGGFCELSVIFILLSVFFIIFLKPFLTKFAVKEKRADFAEQYIGKTAKVISNVTASHGSVTLFDERWEARLNDTSGEEIQAGSDVKIVRNDSTILYVEKI